MNPVGEDEEKETLEAIFCKQSGDKYLYFYILWGCVFLWPAAALNEDFSVLWKQMCKSEGLLNMLTWQLCIMVGL